MHELTPQNEALAREVFELALARRRGPVSLQASAPGAALQPALAAAITPQGLGGSAALRLFAEHVVPASLSADHPGCLAFMPNAPTEASIYADWLVSAFPCFAGTWHDAAGMVAAENAALAWLAGLAGLPAMAGGSFVSGATLGTLSALHAARHATRRHRAERWAVLCSTHAHASVAAAACVMDADLVAVDPAPGVVLTGEAVRDALREDPGLGVVVASAGTTHLGAIDDLPGIAEACRDAGVWLHVDAAYGGAVLVSPQARHRLAGIEHADSLVVDPHKWLFAPYDSCALLFRDPARARPALARHAAYVAPLHDDAGWSPAHYGLQLSRRARGVPLWFSLATYGTEAYAAAVDAALVLTDEVVRAVQAEAVLELHAQPMLSVVVFSRRGWSAGQHAQWSAQQLRDGLAWIAPTCVAGRPALRLCLLNPRANFSHIHRVLTSLRE